MGWKNVQEHYRIGHTVAVTSEGICIGSHYIHNIIVIGMDGEIVKRLDSIVNDDLVRYQREFDADPANLRELIETPDNFEKSITVWTYHGPDIVEKQCEEPGWPNVTHDGCMMYDNTYSIDRATVVRWAKENASAMESNLIDRVAEIRKNLERVEKALSGCRKDIAKLDADYPETPPNK